MTEGGIFTILDNCLHQMSIYNKNSKFEIIALVADKSKFNYPNINFVEFTKSKKNWLNRLYYEYFYFKKLSKKIKPDIWLSLHDISPNVIAEKRFVYCHNPNVFYKPRLQEWFLEYKIGVFYLFYQFLYKINLKKNYAVFVQQNWIKKEFEKRFKINNIIVSKPDYEFTYIKTSLNLDQSKTHFFYPSFPRTFKNFEIIFESLNYLENEILDKIKIYFTLDPSSDNKYTNYLIKKYGKNNSIIFTGKLSKNQINDYYQSIDCLIFPSKLETWGLPISEAKFFKKPMLLANLEYAKETVGNYNDVSFFDVNNPEKLAELLTNFVNKNINFQGNHVAQTSQKELNSWQDLFDYIIKS